LLFRLPQRPALARRSLGGAAGLFFQATDQFGARRISDQPAVGLRQRKGFLFGQTNAGVPAHRVRQGEKSNWSEKEKAALKKTDKGNRRKAFDKIAADALVFLEKNTSIQIWSLGVWISL
jgi:hypothetical protein